ncbi:MAG: TonB-dependent receptor [Pseudomonadales bacterium]
MNNSITQYERKIKLKPLVAAIIVSISGTVNAAILEEVMVTAQKREQSLQDVGVSVSAFTGDQMDALGWTNSMHVAAQTPGLVATSNTGDSGNIALFSIRGVNQGDFAEGQEAPVAIYNDEVYLSSPGASGAPAYDLERVEVLRGPQGTLYGRNATGGLVHYISQKPTDELEASIDLTVAEYGRIGVTAVVSGPLGDRVQGRLAAYHNENDGYIDNAIGEDYRNDDTQSIRGLLNTDFTDTTSLLLIGRYTQIDTRGGVYHNRATKSTDSGPVFCQSGDSDCGNGLTFGPDGLPTPGAQDFFNYTDNPGSLFDAANGQLQDGIGGVHDGAFDFDSGVDRDSSSLTAILKTSFGDNINLTSVTDYTQSDKEYREDDDSSQYDLVTYVATADVKQFSQELRLDGGGEDLTWVTGLYYLTIENNFSGAFQFPSDAYDPVFFSDSETDTISAFGQIDYSLTDALLLTLGLRWTQDEKDLSYQLTGDGAVFDDDSGWLYTGDLYKFDRNDDEISGKVQLDWEAADNQLFYIGYNRGTKGGGFNTPSDGFAEGTAEAIGFDPEVLNSYEIGSKTTFSDGRGRLNASVFYYDYENYQGFFFSGTTSLLINSEATFYGGELELFYSTDNGWDFIAGVALLETEVNGVSNDGSTVIKDQEALLAPDVTANAVVRKEWNVGNGRLAAQVAASYVGKEYFNLVNSIATEAGDYTLTDLRLSYFGAEEKWEASVFVNNVTNEEPVTYGYDISSFGNYSIYVIGPPRWAGVNFKYNFN